MITNRIFIKAENDSIFLSGNEIHVFVNNFEYVYHLSSLKKILINSIIIPPNHFEKCLALQVDKTTEICINSTHICFQPFLFQQLNTALPLSENKLADAMACTKNRTFEEACFGSDQKHGCPERF